jgi:enediyne biosynthesis protein E4
MDNDGRPDLFVSALANETFPLFLNLGKGLFSDGTYRSRIGAATLALSGWGLGAYDFDNDGRKDLFVACGDVNDNTEQFSSRKSKQPNLLLAALPNGTFAPQEIGLPAMHRGAAFADFDGDGKIDAVVSRIGEAPLVLRNTAAPGNHWLGLRLPIGARVRVVTAAGEQWNHVSTSVGYAGASEQTAHFGLGRESAAKLVEIAWPSGGATRLENVQADRYLTPTAPAKAP